jgi:hypothetical protein
LLDLEEATGRDDLTCSATGAAGFFSSTTGRAAASAGFTDSLSVILNLTFGAACGIFQCDLHAVAEIAAALGTITTLTSAATTATAKEGFKDTTTAAATAAEDFAEDVEGIMETATATTAAAPIGKGTVTIAVVGSAFLVVA